MVGTLLISLFMGAINKVTPWGIAEQIGGEVIGAGASIYNNERNIKYQKEANAMNLAENQRNRDFNANEALKQRQFEAQQAELANKFASDEAQNAFKRSSQFALDMWNKENSYNSPSAQIARLKDAGLNPNLFGGNNVAGSVGSVSPVSASPSMAHGASASAGGSIPMQAPVSTTNPAMEMANVRLANATARKAESDAERTEKLLPGEVKTQDMNCRVMDSNIRVNDATVQKLGADVQSLEQSIEQSKAYTRLLGLQGDLQQKELDHYEDNFRMILEKHAQDLSESKSRIRLNDASVKELATRCRLNLANAQNAEDLHILNGANLQFMANGGEEFLVNVRWDEEQKKYNTFIRDYTLHKQQFRTDVAKSKHELKLLEDRKTWYGEALDWIGQTVDALGAPFGAGVNYGYSRGSHSSNSNLNVTGNSNVTTKRAFDITP